MGVMGCGKTSVGLALAERTGLRFVDGDALHPKANIEKMSQGIPLTDADRIPWLKDVGVQFAATAEGLLIGCSALKRCYRDIIRNKAGRPVQFVHLTGSKAVLLERVRQREGPFMPMALLDSQLATLEPPQPDEDAITCQINRPLTDLVDDLVLRTQEKCA